MKGYILILALCPVISVDKTQALTTRQRMRDAERDLAILKLKTEGAEEDIVRNSDILSVLNTTVMELEKCFIGELDKPSKTSHIKGRVLTEDDTHGKHSGRILDAFKQEKFYVKKHVQRMSEAFDGFKEEVMKTAEVESLALNHTAETITSEVDDLREKLNLSEKKQKSEINSLKSSLFTELGASNKKYTVEINSLKSSLETVSTELTVSNKKHTGEINSLNKKHTVEINSLKSSLEMVTAEQADLQTLVNQMMQQLIAIQLIIPCPKGWTKHSKFCYKYFDDGVTFETARKTCAGYNAHVVDVQNENEMEFVMSLVLSATRVWLGLTDTGAEGTWVWERTGAVAQYLNWHPGEPNSWGDEDCVIAVHKRPYDKWVDYGCGYTTSFVCKK